MFKVVDFYNIVCPNKAHLNPFYNFMDSIKNLGIAYKKIMVQKIRWM
ncbi:MAG: hypothetical protein AWU59_2360 [Methanolobus sp. T82-4]|jgi:hypothetical protein|nr:MAG: hypothetical protein AWU59_2360 [Methanolobus sp. T82-4]